MLPSFLESTYTRYKNDTSIFVEWLLDNGTKCGHTVTVKSTAATPVVAVKSARLKGKARKEAQKADGKAKPAPPPAKPSKKVSPGQLLPLAQAIANAKSAVNVSIEIIQAGIRAVSARKKCTSYFSTKIEQDADIVRDNKGHSYFVSLMEEVLLTLQPCFAVSAGQTDVESKAKSTEEPAVSMEELENRYAVLELEEPPEEDQTVPLTTSTPVPSEKPIVEVETPENKANQEEDKIFAIFCLFDDLFELRKYVLEIWTDYQEGSIDYITASVTTNTAIQLAVRAEDEVSKVYSEATEYSSVLETLINYYNPTSGPDGAEEELEVSDEIADWIYAPTHSILASFCDVLEPGTSPITKRGHFGVYNPHADRSEMSASEMFREDMIVLMEVLPEFALIANTKLHLFATDELTKGLCQMALTRDIPVWLTFATQLLLDTHHLLRSQAINPFTHLMFTCKHAQDCLKTYFDLSIMKPSTWSNHHHQIMRAFADELEVLVAKDFVFTLKEKQYKRAKLPTPPESDRHYLFKNHPVLCGMTSFAIILELHRTGIMLNNAMGTLIYPAHFYNTLRQKPDPVAVWPEMEHVISLHGDDRIFVGARPSTMDECFRQICLMLGYSADSFAKNRRKLNASASKKGPRGLKETSTLGILFLAGLRGDGSAALTIHNVEELLNEQALDEKLASNPTSKRLRRQWAQNHRLTTVQLLDALRMSLPSELHKLEFNYFAMYEFDISLLRRSKSWMRTTRHSMGLGIWRTNLNCHSWAHMPL